jgi:peptidoglycan/LPS O-acetylase OafA/YrhL
MRQTATDRLYFLDGLRGWGAMAVLLFHVFVEAFPLSAGITATLRHVFMFNGVLAVWVFFLASGFSLAIAYCRQRDSQTLAKIALGRYVRLGVPILCAAALLYLLFALGMVLPAEQRLPKFQGFLPSAPSLWEVIRFSTFEVFFAYNAATTLIGPLWTMPFELWGSCLVLGALFVVGKLERRAYIYSMLAVVAYLIHPIYAAFVVGLALAEVHVSTLWAQHAAKLSTPATLLFLPGAYAASLLPKEADEHHAAYFAVALLLTLSGIFSRPLSAFLSGRVSRFLGRISFPLYLIHGSLMLSYGNTAYHWVVAPTDLQKLLLNLLIVAVCIGSATLLAPMDRLGIAAAKRFSGFVTSRRLKQPSGGSPEVAELK